jgi:NitT/TauT family transport system substrate-binding protein
MEKNLKIILAVVVVAAVIVGVAAAAMLTKRDSSDTVYYTTLSVTDMKGALARGDIDAFISWEPFCSDAVVSGEGEILVWSGDLMPNHPCCVVAASTAFMEDVENADDLTARFVKAHMDATDWMMDALADPEGENYTLLMTLAREFTNKSEEVLTSAFEHMFYGYEMDNDFVSAIETFTDMYMDLNITTEEKLTERGYEDSADFAESYVNETYLEAAAAIQPSTTILNPDDPIHVGYLNADLHQLGKVVAQDPRVLGDQSMFEKYGLNVVNATGAPFAAGGFVMDGISTGTVDVGYLGCAPAIYKHLNGNIGAEIVAQANSEGSAIVVKVGSGIDSLDDLVNKTVAIPSESSIQFLLLKSALKDEGLELVIRPA